jgi:hypothetical protein
VTIYNAYNVPGSRKVTVTIDVVEAMENQSVSEETLYRILSQQVPDTGAYGSLYITASSFPRLADAMLPEIACNKCVQRIKTLVSDKVVLRAVEKYQTGVAIFWREVGPIHAVLPPFPINEDNATSDDFELSILNEILARQYVIAIILVTWGSYAVGLFHGNSLIASKVGTGHIHKEHKKGGSSQKRFARRTEEQRKDFIKRISTNIEENISGNIPDYIYFGGNRLIYTPLSRYSKYLQSNKTKVSKRFLNFKQANKLALEQSIILVQKPLLFTYKDSML